MTKKSKPAVDLALEHEIHKSERLRSRILASLFWFLALLLTAAALTVPRIVTSIFHDLSFVALYTGFVALVALYETVLTIGLGILIRKGKKMPRFGRFANAFVEINVPTIILIMVSNIYPVDIAFATPPVFFYFVFIVLSALRMDLALSVFTGAIAATTYFTTFLVLRDLHPAPPSAPVLQEPVQHFAKALVFLITGLITGLVAKTIKTEIGRVFHQQEEKERVVSLFGQHVSDRVVEKLLAQDTDGGSETRRVSVMFLDIRNFTSFSESRTPEEVVDYLNGLFDFMIDVVNEHDGIINKFLGDGFMAVFGAPVSEGDDARNAVEAALAITDEVNVRADRGDIPPTRVGVGIHNGDAVTGNVGSMRRKEYTIIGDVVNLASRIEGLNKTFESQVLISESVWDEVKNAGFSAVDLGETPVKGKEKPVRIFKIR